MDFYRKLSIVYNLILVGIAATAVWGFFVHGAFYTWPWDVAEATRNINPTAFAVLTGLAYMYMKMYDLASEKGRIWREAYYNGGVS